MWSKPSVAALLLLLSVVTDARLFGVTLSASLKQSVSYNNLPLGFKPLGIRGGAVDDSDVDFDDSGEVGSVDEVDEEAVEAPNDKSTTLADSAVKAASKSKAKKTATAKSAVNAGLASTSKKASKKRTSKLRIPYILKACMNPLTLIAMTKAYWASLFNLEYLKKESSQDLRSALEEKAKKATGGGSKGKRKMKPGQAKTLSDLPQLNT